MEVGRFVGVLLGTHPPCMIFVEKASVRPFCIREALTVLKDRQVKGINKPIKSASSASKISVVRFLFLFFSTLTSTTNIQELVKQSFPQYPYCKYCAEGSRHAGQNPCEKDGCMLKCR